MSLAIKSYLCDNKDVKLRIAEEKEVIFFEDSKGKQPFLIWLKSLDSTIQARIEQRILRLSLGNYGEYKPLKDGINELKLKFGAGYRVYFGEDGKKIVVLLVGGDKKTQRKDIEKAKAYWKEYLEDKNG